MRMVATIGKIGIAGVLLLAAGCSFAASECPEPATTGVDDFVVLSKEFAPGRNALIYTFVFAGKERETVVSTAECYAVPVGNVLPVNCR